jgi:hypothetical protein
MALRSLIIALVCMLGGLHGGTSAAAHHPGHEDDCAEHRQTVSASVAARKANTKALTLGFHPQVRPHPLVVHRARIMNSQQDQRTLLGLRCLFLI